VARNRAVFACDKPMKELLPEMITKSRCETYCNKWVEKGAASRLKYMKTQKMLFCLKINVNKIEITQKLCFMTEAENNSHCLIAKVANWRSERGTFRFEICDQFTNEVLFSILFVGNIIKINK
jgi:hypothetical protein